MALRSTLRLSLLALVLLALALLALARPPTAVAEDPPFVGWSALLPGLSLPYDVTSPDDCIAGRVKCVDKVIRQMNTRFQPLASSCDHDAIFALTYLRVTEEYRRTIESPTFFDDTPFVNHEDVIFARYYFAAYDAWDAGRIEEVPPAWRVAFDAARDRAVSANGNLLLGINAHVQRDLPFVLYSIGLVGPDGSRKPDHDRVNQILNRVTDDVIAEVARRFDPSIDDGNAPTSLDDFVLFQAVVSWRETAWRHAELLALAPTEEAREQVAQMIESYAESQANGIRAATSYLPLLGGRAARDAYCATHWNS
jgi:Family of unknown function (DUF5995)